jgi:hypothetical protein
MAFWCRLIIKIEFSFAAGKTESAPHPLIHSPGTTHRKNPAQVQRAESSSASGLYEDPKA